MSTYLVYITGHFKNLDDIDDFCSNYLVTNKHLKVFRYVVQNLNTLVITFQSDENPQILSVDIGDTLIYDDRILFYYMVNKDDILSYYMPGNISETLFFENEPTDNKFILNENKQEIFSVDEKERVLNVILDKIEEYGIESLTEKEKNFLDHFNK